PSRPPRPGAFAPFFRPGRVSPSLPPGPTSPLSPIATCPETNTNGPALTAGENGSGCPPAPVRVPPRNSTLIGSSDGVGPNTFGRGIKNRQTVRMNSHLWVHESSATP